MVSSFKTQWLKTLIVLVLPAAASGCLVDADEECSAQQEAGELAPAISFEISSPSPHPIGDEIWLNAQLFRYLNSCKGGGYLGDGCECYLGHVALNFEVTDLACENGSCEVASVETYGTSAALTIVPTAAEVVLTMTARSLPTDGEAAVTVTGELTIEATP